MNVYPPKPPGRFRLRLDIYIFRLKSCKLLDVFIISPLPHILLEELQTAGPLRSTGVTRNHHYYRPIRHPLAFSPFPGFSGYKTYLAPAISRWDEEGFSSCLACPCQRDVASTPPKWSGCISQFQPTMLSSPYGCRLDLRIYSFSRPLLRLLSLRPADSRISQGNTSR